MIAELGKLLGTGGAASALPIVVMYSFFTPSEDFNRHVAEARTGIVQDLIRDLSSEPAGPYRDTLCEALESELAAICLDSAEHPFCIDRMVLLTKGGCR